MIFGHKKNIKIFSHILAKDRFPQSVLFAGPNKVGKRKTALEIAKYLEGHHKEDFLSFSKKDCSCESCHLIERGNFPNVIEIKEISGDLSIKKIREIKEKLSLSSIYKYKIVIINNIEKLSSGATGALLKILEEPGSNTIFFLLTPFPGMIMKTIISRLSVFNFFTFKREEMRSFFDYLNVKLPQFQKEKILDISLGRPGLAKELSIDKKEFSYYISLLENIEKLPSFPILKRFSLAEKIEKENDKIENFLFMAKVWFRDILLARKNNHHFSFSLEENKIKNTANYFSVDKIENILKEIQKTQKYILFSNTSRLLALENLFLSI